MERYSYADIIESVEEDFESSYNLGDNDQQAVLRLVDDFYREIIRDNPVEALMFYVAIYNYLIKNGKSAEYISKLLNDFSKEHAIDQLKNKLSQLEKDQITIDLDKIQSSVN